MLKYIFGTVATMAGIVIAGIGIADIPDQPAVLIALGIALVVLGLAVLLTEGDDSDLEV